MSARFLAAARDHGYAQEGNALRVSREPYYGALRTLYSFHSRVKDPQGAWVRGSHKLYSLQCPQPVFEGYAI